MNELRRKLVASLARAFDCACQFRGGEVIRPPGASLIGYRALQRERLARIVAPHPALGVVLSGAKEIWLGTEVQRFGPGDVFAMPASIPFDVVNEPDATSGTYRSLIFVCPAYLMPSRASAKTDDPQPRAWEVALTADLSQALIHAATVLTTSERVRELAEHRIREVLLLVRDQPAARAVFEQTRSAQVTRLLRSDLARRWSVADVAHLLHTSESTLRRQLAHEGASFRALLRAERMQLAATMLADPARSVAEVADATGYVSRSHFASRFKEVHGTQPRRHSQA